MIPLNYSLTAILFQKQNKIEGDFSNWNSEYKFAIANELNEDLPWLGSYFLLSIYNRALSGTEIYHNYTLGVDNI